MRNSRTVVAAGLLMVEAGVAVLGVLAHYGLTAEYGDVRHSALEEWRWAFTGGIGTPALVVLGVVAAAAAVVSPRSRMRLSALALPVVMVVGMLGVTPIALRTKLDVQYTATPQCVSGEDSGSGPGVRAARRSQEVFESIEHVGHFGGGGGSGIGGCDRSFLLTEDADVLGHYRAALPAAGWRVVVDRARRLRAERGGMAFEVSACGRGGTVWAGDASHRGGVGCDRSGDTVSSPR